MTDRSPPPRAGLAEVARQLDPGATVVSVRRLKGGISASTHRVDLRSTSSPAATAVVVRRFGGSDAEETAEREWATLRFVRRLQVPTPEPLLLDTTGDLLGMPGLVMTCLPGRTWLPATGLERWADSMAETLAAIHDSVVPREGAPENPWVSVWRLDQPPEVLDAFPLSHRIWPVMVEHRALYEATAPVFSHLDFWPGNSLFSRRRLTGVIDWSWPGWQPFAYDVAYWRLDVVLQLGNDSPVVDRFVRTYEAVTGRRVEAMPAWDLAVSTRAVAEPDEWAAVYRLLGRSECSNDVVRHRLSRHVEQALRQLGR